MTFFENHKSDIAHAKQISIRKENLNKTFNDFNNIGTSIELLKDDEEERVLKPITKERSN
jgi:CRISPR/Cas system CMR-associated protein Cmr5 small subunit